MKNWTVYIVKCKDGTLYTGITNNLDKRIKTHNKGKGAKYTKSRRPVRLVISKGGFTRSEALRLEIKVKKQPRAKKIKFLERWLSGEKNETSNS